MVIVNVTMPVPCMPMAIVPGYVIVLMLFETVFIYAFPKKKPRDFSVSGLRRFLLSFDRPKTRQNASCTCTCTIR